MAGYEKGEEGHDYTPWVLLHHTDGLTSADQVLFMCPYKKLLPKPAHPPLLCPSAS